MEPNINTPRMQPSDETLTAHGSPDEFGRTSTHNSYTQPKDHAIAENDDMFDFARIPTRHSLQRRNSINRTSTRGSLRQTRTRNSREIVDPESLPYRALSNEADFNEYTQEVPGGEILKIVKTKDTQQFERYDLVAYTIGDKANPKNWSKLRRWYITMVVGFVTFVAAFCSSVITADIAGVSETFHVSEEVSLLTITVFVVGFGIGPLLFAPLSEMYGRWVIYATTLLPAVIFIIPGAVAKNIGTLIVVRAIDGIAFSAPITLVGGTLSDIWKNEDRAPAMAAFSAAVFCGPAIGPLCGGFLSDAAGWRWLYWLQLILAAIAWFLITFTVPETYTPTILATKAAKMRKETGNERYVTEQELDKRPIMDRLYLFLLRPFQLLFLELIVFLMSLYMAVLYGLLYMFFVAYPIIFQVGKGYSASITGLMFIPIAVGIFLGAAMSPVINTHYLKMVKKYHGAPPAEVRLIPMMISCWFIPIGLFIFAWTSYTDLTWVGPALGGLPVGFGFIILYNAVNNYLVDSYQHQAASALAAKTFLRSIWGASTVLFTNQMQVYDRLNNQWASTLLAFIALACCAIPYLFYFKGASIRKHSRFAYGDAEDEALEKSMEGVVTAEP